MTMPGGAGTLRPACWDEMSFAGVDIVVAVASHPRDIDGTNEVKSFLIVGTQPLFDHNAHRVRIT